MDPSIPNDDATSTFSYDAVEYRGAADAFINLRNLQVVTELFGLKVADLDSCRVLELGCADGTNLFPSAVEFPESQFVGVDLSINAIRNAKEVAKELQLQNIEFRNDRISALGTSLGEFDFILCPGVFSWVSDDERSALLSLCRDHLSPRGVAAISYNVLPGWKWNATLREYALAQVREIDDPHQQIAEVRKVIESRASDPSLPEGSFFTAAHEHLRTRDDAYLFHEYLAEHNQPFEFHQFAALAKDHGLKFLCEADYRLASGFGIDPASRTALAYASVEIREQGYDSFRNTGGRQSILCRADFERESSPRETALQELSIALTAPFDGWKRDPSDPQPTVIPLAQGTITITDPMLRAAARILMDCWPECISLDELYDRASAVVGATKDEADDQRTGFARSLMAIYGAGLIRVFKTAPKLSREISAHPKVTSFVRAAANRELEVVNQWHENMPDMGGEERFILSQLDGNHTLEQLASALKEYRAEHETTTEDTDITDLLTRFAKARLLIG